MMETKRVIVTRYVACDSMKFDDIDKCLAYERELRLKLNCEIDKRRAKIKNLKEEANSFRLIFQIAKCDAHEALGNGKVAIFHRKMLEYYENKCKYQIHMSDLQSERKELKTLINITYKWFEDRSNKATVAKEQRRQKSLRWRQENTPDKWKSPYKIRVSKPPKEDDSE